ncbi:hypothetical protein [Pseudoduganella lutea]|uniref:Uncharacterized protein n=1 Tax=Pseudoduganella lutea TaxID=321985 RepID=A0A4P6KV94_9BURK|nr:hypothetical protein [Pseudoduganella lutea]QBE62595.1 hypothetical protein EWM63_06100 [Pseudoduganella lutea]
MSGAVRLPVMHIATPERRVGTHRYMVRSQPDKFERSPGCARWHANIAVNVEPTTTPTRAPA